MYHVTITFVCWLGYFRSTFINLRENFGRFVKTFIFRLLMVINKSYSYMYIFYIEILFSKKKSLHANHLDM